MKPRHSHKESFFSATPFTNYPPSTSSPALCCFPFSGQSQADHSLGPMDTNIASNPSPPAVRGRQDSPPGRLQPTSGGLLGEQRETKTASFDQKEHDSTRPSPRQETIARENPTLPFIPNLDRRPYLLIMMKRTTNRTQAKAASPTAMDTWGGGGESRQVRTVTENQRARESHTCPNGCHPIGEAALRPAPLSQFLGRSNS